MTFAMSVFGKTIKYKFLILGMLAVRTSLLWLKHSKISNVSVPAINTESNLQEACCRKTKEIRNGDQSQKQIAPMSKGLAISVTKSGPISMFGTTGAAILYKQALQLSQTEVEMSEKEEKKQAEEQKDKKKVEVRDLEAEEVSGGSSTNPPDFKMTLGSVDFS